MSKDRFLKTYANLPEDIRKEVIVIVNDKPYSWNAVFLECQSETDLWHKMIEKLDAMGLI